MARWSWRAADRHIEHVYDQEGVPAEERLRPAIDFEVEAEPANLGDYPHRENLLGRLATLGEEAGTDARTELVFELAPHIEAAQQ